MPLKLKIKYMKLYLRAARRCAVSEMVLINEECVRSGFNIRRANLEAVHGGYV